MKVAQHVEGGPTIVAPETRNLDDLCLALTGWLAGRMPGVEDIRITNLNYPLGAGMSHETILFDAAWRKSGLEQRRGLVVRIKPKRHLVYQDDMFEQQYQLMDLMHRSGRVRVATPLWFEPETQWLGAPFFVMEKVKGRVPVSYPPYAEQGWLVDAAPAQRRWLWEDAVRQLAAIQTVPVSEAGFLNLPGTFSEAFDQETDRWMRFLDWVDPRADLRLLRDGYTQLLAQRPANRPEGIVWGDARLGNMMFSDDFSVAAVMDWEQPSLGGALHDLGWWLYSDHVQTTGKGLPVLDGMGSREETLRLWSEVCGKSTADIDWYEMFAVFKMECLGVHMTALRNMTFAGKPGEQLQRYLGR